MTKALNPPPHWPEPPRTGWVPPEGWRPDRSWGAVPAGWRLWSDGSAEPTGPAPLAESEDIPASGARVGPAITEYPVTVTMPGQWSQSPVPSDDHGFDAPRPRRARPRLRLAITIAATVLGLLITAATVLLFLRIVEFAQEDLPAQSLGPVVSQPAGLAPGAPPRL